MAPPTTQAGPGGAPAPNSQAGKVTYAGQTEAELRAEYERAVAENPGFFGQFATIDDYLRYQAGAARNQTQQQEQLEQVVESYRPPMSSVGSYYLGYDHAALKSMVNDDMDPGTADEQGEAWTKIGNTLAELQSGLTAATEASKGAWRGEAAGAAQGYFTGVAQWSGDAAQAAQLTGNRLSAQQNAAETAKNSMPEPVNFSTADAYKMFFSEPNPFKWAETIDEIEAKFEEKQQAHERAAEVMNTMSAGFQEAGSTMPAFAPPPPMSGTGGGDDSQPPGTPTVPGTPGVPTLPGTGTGTGTGTGVVGPSGTTTTAGFVPPGGGGTTPGPGGGGGGGGGTGGPYPGPGFIPGPGGFPPGGRPGTGPGRGGPNVPGAGRGGPNTPGAGRGGGAGGGGAGGGAGGGRGGLGGGAGSGIGGAAAAKGFGPGGSAGAFGDRAGGFGPSGSGGGVAGVGGAGRGGAGAAGAGAMGGGGARGQGGEDAEHKAPSYLVETEDVFGDGTLVAPPVIGG
ncbi:hypothetical protein [Umezawaea sp.]|uniref:hypothetical protein n=1 Tax=Umezawaea sp. TaxID=1955258 RepID=UPI002ED5633C